MGSTPPKGVVHIHGDFLYFINVTGSEPFMGQCVTKSEQLGRTITETKQGVVEASLSRSALYTPAHVTTVYNDRSIINQGEGSTVCYAV